MDEGKSLPLVSRRERERESAQRSTIQERQHSKGISCNDSSDVDGRVLGLPVRIGKQSFARETEFNRRDRIYRLCACHIAKILAKTTEMARTTMDEIENKYK